MHRSQLLVFLLGLCGAAALARPLVAVLEHPQCSKNPDRAVRPLFERSESGWTALTDPSQAASGVAVWRAIGVGTKASTLRTIPPATLPEPSWTYPRDYLLAVAAGSPLPETPNPTEEFAGWCEAPKNRPILLLSGGSASAPLALSRSSPQRPPNKRLLLKAFRDSLGTTKLCLSDQDSRPVTLTENDLVIADRLQFPSGVALTAISLKRNMTECGSELGGTELPRWFAVSKASKYLGAALTFVGAADFDADGSGEYVFWYSGYNEDGYILFAKDFAEKVRFTWKYH